MTSRTLLAAACVAAVVAACSSQTTGGPGSSPCIPHDDPPHPVDPTVCRPQVASTTSSCGSVCRWSVVIPCVDGTTPRFDWDGGTSETAVDGFTCEKWCHAAAPDGAGNSSCNVQFDADGGISIRVNCNFCDV